MPQLCFETFVSQYFWLVLTLFTLYYIIVTKLLPLISNSFKARSNIDGIVKIQKSKIKDSLLIKDIASLQFVPSLINHSYNSTFSNNFFTWSNKF